jgi:predicted dehydrogenase
MRLALIGCGAVAAKHAQAIAQDGAATLAWLCDVRRDAAEALKMQYAPGAQLAIDFRTVPLRDVDGLVICSPTADHAEQASEGLRSGKHVLCEKPLAANSTQIRALIALRDSSCSVLSVAFQRRTESPYVTVRDLIAERREEFGRLKTIHLFVCERWAQTIEGTWRNDPQLGFGYFGDAGVHQVDSIAFVTESRPCKVSARGNRRNFQVEVVTDICGQWRSMSGDSVTMTAQFVGDAHHWREDISLHFEHADILLRSGEILLCRKNQCVSVSYSAPQSNPIADFLAACRSKKPTAAPAECGLLSALWTEAILASIQSGMPVDIAEE